MTSDEQPVSERTSFEFPPPAGVTPRVKRAILLATVLLTAIGATGTALSPYLLVEYPMLLVALSPDMRHVVLVAGRVAFVPLLVMGTLRRMVGMAATYGLGAVYGYAGLRWAETKYPRFGKLIRFFELMFRRLGAPMLVFWPTYTSSGLAGAARTPFALYLIAMGLGQMGYVAVGYYFGETIAAWTDLLVGFLQEHMVAATAVCVTLVLIQQAIALWRRRVERAKAAAKGEAAS
jgi:membrane protein DedA with SNARE-associated domain